ncbi:MAG: insulinase family protein [Bacillales bacterium]|nr:insulinase family protein [Bacillales bacterium]
MGKFDFFHKLESMTEKAFLGNKLTIYRIKYPNSYMRLVNIQVNFGSRDYMLKSQNNIQYLPYGAAHFLEHLMFWKGNHNVYEDFFKRNAILNAFTTYTDTNFMFNTRPEFVSENLEELFSILNQHQLNDAIVEQEKRVIKNEIDTAKMDQWVDKHYRMLHLLCNGSPVSIYPAGNHSDIDSLTTKELKTAYQTFYQPKNMKLFIIGGREELDDIISHKLESYENNQEHCSLSRHLEPRCDLLSKDVFQNYKSNIGISGFMIGVLLPRSKDNELLLKQKVYWEIFLRALFHIGSPFIQELQKSNKIFLQNLAMHTHFTEDVSFIILDLQGEKSEILFEAWNANILNDRKKVSKWLSYGKEVFLNNIIYESDYLRKLFDWISDYAYYDCSLLKVYQIVENMRDDDFLRLMHFFIEAKKVYISYT